MVGEMGVSLDKGPYVPAETSSSSSSVGPNVCACVMESALDPLPGNFCDSQSEKIFRERTEDASRLLVCDVIDWNVIVEGRVSATLDILGKFKAGGSLRVQQRRTTSASGLS